MASAADRMRLMRDRHRAGGLREVRLIVPDTRRDDTRKALAQQVANLSATDEQAALDWIEEVGEFDAAR